MSGASQQQRVSLHSMNHGAESLSFQGHGLLDRRGFLGRSATALGSVALTHLLGRGPSGGPTGIGFSLRGPGPPQSSASPALLPKGAECHCYLLRRGRQPTGDLGLQARTPPLG